MLVGLTVAAAAPAHFFAPQPALRYGIEGAYLGSQAGAGAAFPRVAAAAVIAPPGPPAGPSWTPAAGAAARLPRGLVPMVFGAVVASFAAGGSFARVDRRKLLEEDEANSYRELEIVSEKLRQEDTRLVMLQLNSQIKDMREKMAGDAEEYAKKLPGVLPFLGYFDPLGLSRKLGFSSVHYEEKVNFYREAELKHGRLGTLAALGIVVSEKFHPLGGVLALNNTQLLLPTALLLGTIALPDINSVPLVSPTDKAKQTTELNGTRVGMLAATSMIAKEMATKTCFLYSLAAGAPEASVVSQAAVAEAAVVSQAATAMAEAV